MSELPKQETEPPTLAAVNNSDSNNNNNNNSDNKVNNEQEQGQEQGQGQGQGSYRPYKRRVYLLLLSAATDLFIRGDQHEKRIVIMLVKT